MPGNLPGSVARQRWQRSRRRQKTTAKDGPVRGRCAIARVLRCHPNTLDGLTQRRVDPLRLWSSDHDRTPWALRSRLVAYRQRWQTPDDPAIPRVRGWDAIGQTIGVHPETAERLARRGYDPLPVGFSATGKREAYLHAILDWLDAQNRPHGARRPKVPRQVEPARRAA